MSLLFSRLLHVLLFCFILFYFQYCKHSYFILYDDHLILNVWCCSASFCCEEGSYQNHYYFILLYIFRNLMQVLILFYILFNVVFVLLFCLLLDRIILHQTNVSCLFSLFS